jgi:ABC-type transport system involved in multi-copper enzyme maturation permease subunit
MRSRWSHKMMKLPARFASLLEQGPTGAIIARELQAAILNRYLQVFCTLAVAGGIGAALLADTADAAPMLILQIALYFVSLFALLIGTSSARAESSEWPLLFAQPMPRAAFLLGKFIALSLMFAGLLALLFLPTLFVRSPDAILLGLYGRTLTLAGVLIALGLGAGFLARDRVQGLVLGVSVWLFFLFGLDLVALLAARSSLLQQTPDLWSVVLMLNPLDAFRIDALFAMERIPAETARHTGLTTWWLGHSGFWFLLISIVWMSGFLAATARRLTTWEE